MRERRYFLIAEKYGQSPSQVRDWSDYDFNRALLYFEAEAGDGKMTPDDVEKVKEKRIMARPGYVLDLPYEHWQKFITNGQVDEAKLVEGNYTPEQFEYIRDEVSAMGWLEPTTQPLEPTD